MWYFVLLALCLLYHAQPESCTMHSQRPPPRTAIVLHHTQPASSSIHSQRPPPCAASVLHHAQPESSTMHSQRPPPCTASVLHHAQPAASSMHCQRSSPRTASDYNVQITILKLYYNVKCVLSFIAQCILHFQYVIMTSSHPGDNLKLKKKYIK